jgi:hypothetical protein
MYKLYFLETLWGRGIQNQHNKSARIAWLAMVYSTKKSISSLEHEGNIKLSTFEWLRLRFSFDTFLSFKIFLISFSSMLDQSHPPSRSNAKTANVSSGSTSSWLWSALSIGLSWPQRNAPCSPAKSASRTYNCKLAGGSATNSHSIAAVQPKSLIQNEAGIRKRYFT